MTLVNLIFALVARFVPMGQKEARDLKKEADDWEIGLDEEKGNAVEKLYIKANDPWYMRLSYAVSYIFLVRAILNFMSDEEELEDIPNI
jgi:hypothetical protein